MNIERTSEIHISLGRGVFVSESDTIFLPEFSQAPALEDTDTPSKPTSEVSGLSLASLSLHLQTGQRARALLTWILGLGLHL